MAYHAQSLGSEWYHSFPMGWRTLELWCHPALDKNSSKLSSTLIELAGLDPATATIEQMEERDARFVLMKQYSGAAYRFRELTARRIFAWRGAVCVFNLLSSSEMVHVLMQVQYYVDCGPVYGRSPQPIFRLATEEGTQAAREHTASLEQTARVWSSNHCHAFYGAADVVSKPAILDHLKNEHDIPNPTMGTDYILHPNMRMALEAHCELPGSPFEGHEEYHAKEESQDSSLEDLAWAPWS